MINRIFRAFRLTNTILFNVARPRRDPSIPTQSSKMMPFSIGYLHDNPGARRYPKELGRGPGSGKGKFSARGMKGDKARSGGGVSVRFEGGQTPIHRRLPKYGRVKRRHPKQILNTVNASSLHYFIQKGIIDPTQPITIKVLHDVGLAKKIKFGVKILAKGLEEISYPIHLQVTDASKTVIEKIQKVGGSVKLIYRTSLKLKEHVFPQRYPLPLKQPIPPAYRVRKLDRMSRHRKVYVEYKRPQWKLEDEAHQKQHGVKEQKFIYPVPRVPNPDKIRTRKERLYRKISYNI